MGGRTKTGGRQVDSIRKVSDPFEVVEGKRKSTRCRLCARSKWIGGKQAEAAAAATATVTATVTVAPVAVAAGSGN